MEILQIRILQFGIFIFKEMLRNQSRERNHKVILASPESSSYIEGSHFIVKPMNTNEFPQVLEKTRTYSHKKLSLTSTAPVPIPNECVRKVTTPVFEMNKFYKNPIKGNCLIQSKKLNTQDAKVSLRLSNAIVPDMNSPLKNNQNSRVQFKPTHWQPMPPSIQKQDATKAQLKDFINSKCHMLLCQITSQSAIINQLRNKIQNLETQIKNKNQIINNMIQQKRNSINQKSHQINLTASKSYQQQLLTKRLSDVQKILSTISIQSTKTQNTINQKLQNLTKQMVQLTLTNVSNVSSQRIKSILDNLSYKVNSWLSSNDTKVLTLQFKIQQVVNALKTEQTSNMKNRQRLNQISSMFDGMKQQIDKLQQRLKSSKCKCKYESKQSIQNTKQIQQTNTVSISNNSNIGYWQCFQDFIATNQYGQQLQNNSIFGQDDYFFHPSLNSNNSGVCTGMKLKTSRQSSNFTATTISSIESSTQPYHAPIHPTNIPISTHNHTNTTHPNHTYPNPQPTSTSTSTPTSYSTFDNLVSIMKHIKTNYQHQLPLKVNIDKYNRIVVKSTNKLLYNQCTNNYYKINNQEVQILVGRNCIQVQQQL